MGMNTIEQCEMCIYYKNISKVDGLCRFSPPKVFQNTQIHDQTSYSTWWPTVSNDDWCGKFKRFK